MSTTSLPGSGYFQRITIALCVASYDPIDSIAAAVKTSTGFDVFWGPASSIPPSEASDPTDSLAFVAKAPAEDSYIVVVRGTNYQSFYSWLTEDFDVTSTVPLNQLPGAGSVPSSATLSQGTFNGLQDVLGLTDPSTGKGLVDYLRAQTISSLMVTGHSLGGTLTVPLLAYLTAVQPPVAAGETSYFSFAALTPGTEGFRDYCASTGIATDAILNRLHNPRDVAPFCWVSESSIVGIYKDHGLTIPDLDKDALDLLFTDADAAGPYVHPEGRLALPDRFNEQLNDWDDQALYQHRSTTYQSLVLQAFPPEA